MSFIASLKRERSSAVWNIPIFPSDIVTVASTPPFRSSLTRSYAMRSGGKCRTAIVT